MRVGPSSSVPVLGMDMENSGLAPSAAGCWLLVAGAGLRAFFPRIQERPSVAGAVSPPLLFQKVIRNYFILEKSFIFVFVL